MNELINKMILLFESADYSKLVLYLLLIPMFFVPAFTYILFFNNNIFYEMEFAKLLMLILVSNFVFIFFVILFGIFKEVELLSPYKKKLSEIRAELLIVNSANERNTEVLTNFENRIQNLHDKNDKFDSMIMNVGADDEKKQRQEAHKLIESEIQLIEIEKNSMEESTDSFRSQIEHHLNEIESLENKLKDFRLEVTITSILLESYIYISYIWINHLFLPDLFKDSKSGKTYIMFALLTSLIFHTNSIIKTNKGLEKNYKIKYKFKIIFIILLIVLIALRMYKPNAIFE